MTGWRYDSVSDCSLNRIPGQYGPLEIQVFSGRIILEGFNGDGGPDLLGEPQK